LAVAAARKTEPFTPADCTDDSDGNDSSGGGHQCGDGGNKRMPSIGADDDNEEEGTPGEGTGVNRDKDSEGRVSSTDSEEGQSNSASPQPKKKKKPRTAKGQTILPDSRRTSKRHETV
jgi:hypothetical protein